ncbi:MAG TPA: hypothetical protein VJX68_01835 [Candidatus Binatus sp.]|uniref:hypothetical protein n=1 Tax=Candidatus Binatus sp. TaxID=2811406 RepID=UPI002B4933F2|nr:hypothetical protein [Candidatus Binatus sp.]HKN11912.1 hypothetical protein [Candidatus Binatus sp.]
MADQTPQSARAPRGWFLTVMTVLFLLLALSDFTKAFQFANNPAIGGLVVLGHKFHGVAHNLVLGPIFGIVLLIYAFGIWNMRAWVLPLSIVYAFYVPVNMVMFWSLHQLPPPTVGFIVMYLFLSLTGSVGTAIYLAYHRERLN